MKAYTIKQLGKLAGVTVRALHYYDQIGLLKPLCVQNNGYRYYGEQELVRLQQILFFRELEFPLAEIKNILDSPNFDPIQALKDQRRIIKLKQSRLDGLIKTIDRRINDMKKQNQLSVKDMFGSFSKEEYEKHKKEAQERWGKGNIEKSEQIVRGWSKDKTDEMQVEGDAINRGFVANMDKGIKSPEVQALIDRHFKYIIQFYDKSWPLHEIYRGLGQMYVDDPRFAKNYTVYHPNLPQFMRDAMAYYCDQHEK